MMRCMHSAKISPMNKLQIKVQPDFLITLSLALILIPVPWLLSWLVAAAIHELFHLIMLRLCRYTVMSFNIGASGAGIEADMEPGLKMVLCAAAGPLAGFMLLPAVHIIPRIAICGLLQSLCNLLPVYPLDGSRLLIGFLSLCLEQNAVVKICSYIEKMVIAAIVITACYGTFRLHLGIMPLILMFVMLTKKKYLANHYAWRYNIGNRK